jgi:heme exporter protein B
MREPSFFRAALAIVRKDLRIELRTGEVVITTALFATLVTVLTSLSFYMDDQSALLMAPGVLWISVAFAGVLAMSRSWSRERDHDSFRALLSSPAPRAAIYLGKLLGTLSFLFVVECVLVIQVAVLFNVDLLRVIGPLSLLLALGSVGFAATGNLFAAMGVRTQTRDMVLAVALFPVIAPALLAGVVATRELFGGAPLAEIWQWARILLGFDVAFLTAGMLLFEPLVCD